MRKLMIMLLCVMSLLSFKLSESYNKSTASWYGYSTKRITASGQVFDNNGMTAAHKTLKFGTKVEVINTANNKVVIVKITDRGPFAKGRDLDLSKGAFNKIAKLSTGVINIKYKVLE